MTDQEQGPEGYIKLRELLKRIEKIYSENSEPLFLQADFHAIRLRAWFRSNLPAITFAFVFLAGVSGYALYAEVASTGLSALYLLVMAIFIGLAMGMYAQRNKNWERNDNLIDAVIPHFPTSGLLWRMKSQLASEKCTNSAFVETGSGKGDSIVGFDENLFSHELSGLLFSPKRADRELFIRHVAKTYPGNESMEPIRVAIPKDVAKYLMALERARATRDMTFLADCSGYALDRLKDASLSAAKADRWKIEWSWKIINEIRDIRLDTQGCLDQLRYRIGRRTVYAFPVQQRRRSMDRDASAALVLAARA